MEHNLKGRQTRPLACAGYRPFPWQLGKLAGHQGNSLFKALAGRRMADSVNHVLSVCVAIMRTRGLRFFHLVPHHTTPHSRLLNIESLVVSLLCETDIARCPELRLYYTQNRTWVVVTCINPDTNTTKSLELHDQVMALINIVRVAAEATGIGPTDKRWVVGEAGLAPGDKNGLTWSNGCLPTSAR